MPKEVTNEELARMIADGFLNTATKEELNQVGSRLGEVDGRLEDVDRRLGIVERKLDRVLYDEIDRHERWIKQLADKVGIELTR